MSPNKLMDYMMAGKPVIFAIDAGNDMVADASCGISIEPENSAAIAKAAIQLAETPQDQLQKMGGAGQSVHFGTPRIRCFGKINFWTSSLCQRGRSEFYPKQAGLSGFLPAVLSIAGICTGN